jgi:hypothetical protein
MSDVAIRALLHGAGRVGEALDVVRACEQGDRASLDQLAPGRRDELMAMHDHATDVARRRHATAATTPVVAAIAEAPEPA